MADGNHGLDRRKMRAVALLLVAALATAACGEKDEPDPVAQQPATTTTPEPAGAGTLNDPPDEDPGEAPWDESTVPAEAPPGDPRLTALERSAIRTARQYIAALDAGDGAAVCKLLAPDALKGLELPRPRGECGASLTASIGYRDPRGLPVWEGADAGRVRVAELSDGGRAARVVATVATRFADRDEVSVEDDVIYLSRVDGAWRIAKPSASLYRAVGISDIPVAVVAPPTG